MLRTVVTALLAAAALVAQERELRGIAEKARQRWGARTGFLVVGGDGTVLAHRAAKKGFTPASNMKVLSAAAVLHRLGPDHRCRTAFALEEGELVVTAGGDPNWITGTEHDPARLLAGVVAELKEKGVEAVRGVRAEPGPFGGEGRPGTWPRDQREYYYCAPTGGLVLEEGCLRVRLEPVGGRAEAVLVAPPVDVPRRGRIRVTGDRSEHGYGVRDAAGTLHLHGRMWKGAPARIATAAVDDPLVWFVAAVERALRAGGVRIDPAAPARDLELGDVGTTLAPALHRSLRESSNFAAEQCLRVLAAATSEDASLAGARRAFRRELAALVGPLPEGTVLLDGSGLSRGNRIAPILVAAALKATLDGPHGAFFVDALPTAAEDGGLDDRFVDTPLEGRVHAKTGWIAGASSLSGVLETEGGRCIFSILMNYDPGRHGLNKHFKRCQEEMVAAMEGLSR